MRRTCLFSHFDRFGIIAPHVLHYVKALVACGFDVRIISTADGLRAEDKAAVQALGASLYIKPNRGYDFGSWQFELQRDPGILDSDEVLLANDSVYGPIQPLPPLVERMRELDADVVGMTDSRQFHWHMQSYFLLFKSQRAIRELLPKVLGRDFVSLSKFELIMSSEVGLGRMIRAGGFTGKALFPIDSFDEGEYVKPCNSTHAYWRKLLDAGYPFIKVELLRDNPMGVEIAGWSDVVEASAFMPTGAIRNHLVAIGSPADGQTKRARREYGLDPIRRSVRWLHQRVPIVAEGVRGWRSLQRTYQEMSAKKEFVT